MESVVESQSDMLVPLTFDTGLVPEPMRFDAWRSALSSLDVSRRGKEPFAGAARLWMLEPLLLTHALVDPLRYDRDEDRVRRDIKDHCAVVVLQTGEFVGDYGRGEIVSRPGSVTVLDMRRPCWTDATRLEAFVLSLPRAFLMPGLEDCDPHGMVVEGGLASLLSAFLRGVATELPGIARSQAPVVARSIRDLLAATLLDAHRSGEATNRRHEALISRVRAYIDEHLTRQLDIGTICKAVNVSRSSLYRAFGGGGGVLQQVQRRRFHALRALLADPAETRSIAALARSVGFADRSHLNRAFKREYGCTPGQYRAEGPDADRTIPADQAPRAFERWTTLLD